MKWWLNVVRKGGLTLLLGTFLISACVAPVEEPRFQVPTVTGDIADAATAQAAVSYTHLTLPTN